MSSITHEVVNCLLAVGISSLERKGVEVGFRVTGTADNEVTLVFRGSDLRPTYRIRETARKALIEKGFSIEESLRGMRVSKDLL